MRDGVRRAPCARRGSYISARRGVLRQSLPGDRGRRAGWAACDQGRTLRVGAGTEPCRTTTDQEGGVMRKLAFIVGLAVGYVLGARAGRERYEQLRKSARDFSQTPAVQKATRTAKETAGGVTGKAADTLAAKLGD